MFLYLQRFKRKANARMVKLVDTLVSGTSERKLVQVRVLFRARRELAIALFFIYYQIVTTIIIHDNYKSGNMMETFPG
jgi:hypothetical protein